MGGFRQPVGWLAGWLAGCISSWSTWISIHPPICFSVRTELAGGCLAGSIVGATDAPAFQRTIRKLIIKDFDDAMMTTTALTSRGSIKNPYSYHAICTWIVSVRYILRASEWRHCLLIWMLLYCLIYNIERSIIKQKKIVPQIEGWWQEGKVKTRGRVEGKGSDSALPP